jgi:hypothetical protein
VRSEAEILATLARYGEVDEFAILDGGIVQLPTESGRDVLALVIEDEELASDCRAYLLGHGAPEFAEWSDLQAELKARFERSR